MDPVVIVGGGPAGSALGCYLSMAGIDNIILERAIHPRPHVGESLVSSTTRVFQDIGFVQTMEEAGFVYKYGAAWHPPQGTATVAIEFREFPNIGVFQDYSYHVDRAKMDMLLLKHADSLGSKVYQGTPVNRVLFDENGGACGVEAELAGQKLEIPAGLVIDATGRNALLGRQLKIQDKDPNFNQFCVHAWFEGVERGPAETADDIHIYFLPVKRGWAWQIPIDDKVTSIGVVAEKNVFRKSRKDKDAWFMEQIESAPDFRGAMRDAKRINDFSDEGDYSYAMKRFVGDGFMLIGDAARFVDPIFSSGVSVALHSAKMASETISASIKLGDLSESALRPYEARLKKGTRIWYEFIRLYYKALPLFTYFIEHPDYRQELFQLLQGEVFDREEAPVLDAMRKYIEEIERNEGHVFRNTLDSTIDV